MGLMERFSGQRDPDEPDAPVANPDAGRPVSYQMLFPGPLDLDADALTLALRAFHPSLGRAQAELLEVTLQDAAPGEADSLVGLLAWEAHVVKLIGFSTPVPEAVFEACTHDVTYRAELAEAARAHRGHAILAYAGYDADPLEQYIALTIAAVALAKCGAILLLNESARTSFPAEALLVQEPELDAIEALRGLPIPLLYGGFARFAVPDEEGVWMRTFGNVRLNLPDLALRAEGYDRGGEVFDLFANLLDYLRESGKRFVPGDTVQVEEGLRLRLRAPAEGEWYLESDGEMLVAERDGGA
jgi:hypothetical protein